MISVEYRQNWWEKLKRVLGPEEMEVGPGANPRLEYANFNRTGDYLARNYARKEILEADKQIMQLYTGYLRGIYGLPEPSSRRWGLSLGTGPALHEVLMMLPYMGVIESRDPAYSTDRYLRAQMKLIDHVIWAKYIGFICGCDPAAYGSYGFQEGLARRLRPGIDVAEELPDEYYDFGSALFVFESVIKYGFSFDEICAHFARSIKPNGHMVSAFMENSAGWSEGGWRYPAFPVNEAIVREVFGQWSGDVEVTRILADRKIRGGYTGILFLTATKS